MTKDEIIAFIKSHPIFQLATVEGNEPHVRTLALYRADENGIIFHTHTYKDLYTQLSANPRVELCFTSVQPASEIRVSGSVELVEDQGLKEQIEPDDVETLAVYVLKNGKATTWTKETENQPKTYVQL